MSTPRPIHPFPARMAPELALRAVKELPKNSIVLDPMMGSGTVVRVAVEAGHHAIGRDVDPLAVLMSKVWTTPVDTELLRAAAQELVVQARNASASDLQLPWIDDDVETTGFTEYWFAQAQRQHLRQLSYYLHRRDDVIGDALRIALSRIIVTKERGASLARDVSHSRPHRVAESNSYQVFEGFLESVKRLSHRLDVDPPPGRASIAAGDARHLDLGTATVDAVVTSPPYLNAIDYLRGHKLALVWLGYSIGELRTIRGDSIGTERGVTVASNQTLFKDTLKRIELPASFPQAKRRVLARYVLDLHVLLTELHRVLKPGGRALFVVGNCFIQDVYINNSRIVALILNQLGFRHRYHYSRILPANRRYLPPPNLGDSNDLTRRMRQEVILSYTRI